MQIFVRVFEGTIAIYDVQSDDSIGSVKEKLCLKQGGCIHSQLGIAMAIAIAIDCAAAYSILVRPSIAA